MIKLDEDIQLKLREVIKDADRLLLSDDVNDVLDVLSDKIIESLDEEQEPTPKTIQLERLYDTVFYESEVV